MTKFYIGSKGGGKGGGSQRTPVEDKDSLRSRAYAKLIDVVSEGQVGGLVNGLKSIYLDDVPLQNADGSYNFEDVAVEFKDGSIGQSALSNMDGVDSTQSINVALKYNIPAVRTINSPEADYARVSIAVGQLSKQNTSNGDVHGTSVAHSIEYRANGGAWQTVKTDVIEGKTMSGYERSVTFKLAGSAPWDVRITRTTADSASQALQNASKWSTLTSVIADKFRFPGTALLGMQINAEQFSNIPARAYHLKGLVIKVPSNYDPVTRVYSGAWNGTFKMAWTDNPVWCLYDLLTNERYGLGTRIDAGMIDKWELYQIAQYCDQLVPDGHGGMEPRFTCNLYLQTRTEAYKFIQDMAAIFRGISYWASGSIAVKSDMSSPVRYQFNNSNVENGVFERAGSNIQTRHNVALVTWNDPADMGRQKIEYVEDFEAIQKMGYVSETEVAAFGCTSQGQAHRLGEWLLYTEQYESEIVSFTAGADGAIPLPSDVIQISDVYRAGERRGGRVLAGSTKTSAKLDAPVTLATGKTYTLSTIDVDGGFQSATVTTGAGSHATLAVTPFAKDIAENATWILSDATLAPEIFKVIGVDEVENGKYKISCLSHNPSKYGYIEREQALTAPQTSNLQDQKPDVSDVVVTEVTATDKNDIPINKLNVSWKPANAASTAFFVEYRTDSGAWQRMPTSSQYFAEISPVAENVTYQIRVVAGNRLLGVWSNPQAIEYTPVAYQVPAITNLVTATAWSTGQDVTIKWDVVNAKAYEVQVLEGATVRRIIKATESTYTYTAQDYKADGCNTRSLTFKVRAISSNGRTGAWSQVVATNAQVGALQGILVSGSTEQAFFEYAKPTDADFAGVIVWVGTTANFTPSDANKVYDGNDTVITLSKLTNGTKFAAGTTYYLKCAGYDTFGKDALAVSASVAFSVYSVTQMVADLQATQLNQDLRTEIDKISGTGAGSVSARVAQEASNRATAIAAEASARATADTTESTARSNADGALSSRIDTVSASVNSNNTAQTAALQTEKTARINADGALGTRIDTVVAQANTDRTNAQALVTNEATARANADSAQAQQIGTLTATVNTNNTNQTAAIQNEATLRANADGALGTRIDTVVAQANTDRTNAQALVTNEATARANADSAQAQQIGTLTATVNTNNTNQTAAIQNEATLRANADSANANAIQTVQTTVNGHTSSIQTQAQSINGLSAQYTVKIDTGGKVSGYGLASTPINGTPTSSFIVNADKFGIGSSSTGNLMPFVVDTERGVIGMSGQVLIDGTLTTNKLLVGNTSNLIPNSDFATGDATNWRLYTGTDKISFIQLAGAPTKYVCRFASGASSVSMFTHVNSYNMTGADKDGIVVNAGEQYSVSIDAVKSSTLTTGTRIRVMAFFYKTDGTYNTVVTTITLTSSVTTEWATYTGSFTVPEGAVRCWLYVIMDWSPTAGDFYWTNLTCRPMIGDALIVDGGIRARHIGANEVTADKINVTNLEAVNANTGNLKATGAIYGGGYTTAHAGNNDTWPASGVTGFALSQNGLKIGNKTNNKFIRITPDGNLYAPTWSSVNGKLTINELDVIDTHNIVDDALTRAVSFYSGAGTRAVDFMSATITLTAPSKLIIFPSWEALASGNSMQEIYINDSLYRRISYLDYFSNVFFTNLAAGTYTVKFTQYGAIYSIRERSLLLLAVAK